MGLRQGKWDADTRAARVLGAPALADGTHGSRGLWGTRGGGAAYPGNEQEESHTRTPVSQLRPLQGT